VQCIGCNAHGVEFIAQFVSSTLGTYECNAATATSSDGADNAVLLAWFDEEYVMFHGGYAAGVWLGCVFHWIF
jgi:hypothetical protein